MLRRDRGFTPVIIVMIVAVIGIVAAYYLGTQKNNQNPQSIASPTPNQTAYPLTSPIPKTTKTSTPVTNFAALKNIGYTLPAGWRADISQTGLLVSPEKDGGYLNILAYDYLVDTGRREYFCQILKDVCIKETYFTEMNLGNIPGYEAHNVDASGSGPFYFGAKGNKFYLIASYSPPSPNEFDKGYKQVLESLRF